MYRGFGLAGGLSLWGSISVPGREWHTQNFYLGPHTQTDVWIFCTERKPDCDQSIQIKASGVLILGETETEISQELAKEEVDELYDFLLQS